MAVLREICKSSSAGLCPHFLSPLSQSQLIVYMAESCSKMGIESVESKELRAQGYQIQLLSLQTLHQAVPSSLPILNSCASILHSTKELLSLVPERTILPWLLKSRGIW